MFFLLFYGFQLFLIQGGNMFSLENRRILVTGATGGIGDAIARAFHAQGATIGIVGRRRDVLEKLAQDLGGDRVHIFPSDFESTDEVEALIPHVESEMGPLDTLVNNAGITRDGLIMRMKDEDFQKVLFVNLEVPFRLSRAVIRGMMKNRFGRIINITSIVGVTGNPGQVNYCAAKAGMIGMTKSLAKEVASRGITANCIAPGFIKSPMTDILNDDQRARILQDIPTGSIGDPQDIAAAAVFLSSQEASYVTGQTLHVNGGMAMI